MSNTNKIPGRVWYLDWVRAFACAAVVLIHCFTVYLDNTSITEVGVFRSVAWTEILVVFCRWAVPCFLMVTGALLLDPSRRVGSEKISRYVLRVVTVLMTFGWLFALIEIVFSRQAFDFSMVYTAFLNVLQGKGWAHLWYLYDLMGIYLLLPLFRAFVANSEKRDLQRMLSILFFFSLVIPTFNSITALNLKRYLWLGSSVFYFMLGWYLHAFKEPRKTIYSLGFAALICQVLITGYGIMVEHTYPNWVWLPASPLTAMWAATVFSLFKNNMDVPMHATGLVASLAACSFGVYVIHPLFLNFMYKALNWSAISLPILVFEIVTFVLALFPSWFSTWVLRKTPLFRKVF